jgi:hypothetical protein
MLFLFYFFSLALQLSASYGLLSQAMASCRGLWPPVAGYGLLSQAMASCRRLWPPVAGYGLLSRAMASCRRLWPPHSRGYLITHNDVPQSVGIRWMSDQLVADSPTFGQPKSTLPYTVIHRLTTGIRSEKCVVVRTS